MDTEKKAQIHYYSLLLLLFFCAILLTSRLVYTFLSDSERFPIHTVKLSARYQHITRNELESVLTPYFNYSFFAIPVSKLHHAIEGLDWADIVDVERIWPDTLKIKVTEKEPVAWFNDDLLTSDGRLFRMKDQKLSPHLPKLSGPPHQEADVLQIYQKLSMLLAKCELQISALHQHETKAIELTLDNGVKLQLGKQEHEMRIERFCKAWPGITAQKQDQLSGVDLRYARGMAIQWKQQTGR